MLNIIIKLTRIGVVIFWAAMILSVASVIPAPFGPPIIWIGIAVLLIHLFEYVFVKTKFDSRGGTEISFAKTIVFGFSHWLPLVNGHRARTGDSG